SATLQGDDHRAWIAKEPVDVGQRFKPREPIKVPQLSSGWHRDIVASFSGEKKRKFPGNIRLSWPWRGRIYPLGNPKTQIYKKIEERREQEDGRECLDIQRCAALAHR